jgi:hypothetical protein
MDQETINKFCLFVIFILFLLAMMLPKEGGGMKSYVIVDERVRRAIQQAKKNKIGRRRSI